MWDRLPACRRDSAVAGGYWIKKIGGKKMGGKNIRALAVAKVAETFGCGVGFQPAIGRGAVA